MNAQKRKTILTENSDLKTLREPLTTLPESNFFIFQRYSTVSKMEAVKPCWVVFKPVGGVGGIPPQSTSLGRSSVGAGGASVSRGVADATRARSLGSGGFVSGHSPRSPPLLNPSVSPKGP